MVERRRAPRHNLTHYLRVYDRDTQDLFGRVVDVSRHGMMLVNDKPYEAGGARRQLRMVLPPTLETTLHVDFDAECRWGGPDVNAELFDGGFEFVDISDDLKDTLDLVVDELAFGRALDMD